MHLMVVFNKQNNFETELLDKIDKLIMAQRAPKVATCGPRARANRPGPTKRFKSR